MKHLIFIVALATLTGACSVVYSDLPLGVETRIDPLMWEGVWKYADDHDDLIRVHVVDAANGELLITALESDPVANEPFEVCALTAFVRHTGDWTFVSVSTGDIDACPDDDNRDEETNPSYVWVVTEITGDGMLYWLPRAEGFDELVDHGELPGDRADWDVTLRTLEAHHYDVIQANVGALFDWRHPEMLRRVVPVQTP